MASVGGLSVCWCWVGLGHHCKFPETVQFLSCTSFIGEIAWATGVVSRLSCLVCRLLSPASSFIFFVVSFSSLSEMFFFTLNLALSDGGGGGCCRMLSKQVKLTCARLSSKPDRYPSDDLEGNGCTVLHCIAFVV